MKFSGFIYAHQLRSVGPILFAIGACIGCGHPAFQVRTVPAQEVSTIPGAARTESPRPQPVDELQRVTHVVRRGETLWRIAHTYAVAADQIAVANRLDDPTRLEIGQRLLIPGAERELTIPPATQTAAAVKFLWPVPGGELLSPFGADRRSHRHQGIDIRGTRGQPVLSAAGGRVLYSGAGMRGYGKTIIVDHGNEFHTLYAHNSELLVRVGQAIRAGQPIARVGRTGNASAEHCHFELRKRDRAIDPMPYLNPRAEALR